MIKVLVLNLSSLILLLKKNSWLSAFSLLLLAFCLPACSFNANMQERGERYLQGEWQQDTSLLQRRLVNYSLYHFNFSCDSVFVSIKSFSKVNPGADSCMAAGHWAEYAKGVYQQKNDTVYIKGLFCNADQSLKDPGGCFRSGVYEESFKMSKLGDSALQFFPTSNVLSFTAHLIKRNTCNPKPL